MNQGQPQASASHVWTLARTVITPLQHPQMFKASASIFCHKCSSGIDLFFVVKYFKEKNKKKKTNATGDPVE